MKLKAKTSCLSPQEVEGRLVAAGIQPTAQRIAICRYVLCEADHPTAEDVKRWADANFPKLSMATVYNTLGALVKAKLVKELRFPNSDKSVYDNNVTDHFHFLDVETGELVDLDKEQFAVVPKLGGGFEVSAVEVIVHGRRRNK